MLEVMDTMMLVPRSSSIRGALRRINESPFRMVFIMAKNGELLGTLTDGDIRRAILRGTSLSSTVADIMNTDPIALKSTWNKKERETFLRSKKVRVRSLPDHAAIPIVDEHGTILDIVRYGGGVIQSLKDPNATRALRPVKKVLVIGGAGYIGSVLVRRLLEAGYAVTVLDSFLYTQSSLDSVRTNKKLTIVKGDSRHVEDITEAMRDADAVVHLAELVGDPACAHDPRKALETNYHATRLAADISKDLGIRRFVYTSSCSVYGASESDELLTEDSALNPVSLYARMKIDSEKALLDIADQDFSPTILRLATVYGESFRPRFDLVVNLLTAKAVREKKITVFGGNQWRPNVHVKDVGQAILRSLEAPIKDVAEEVFNVGCSKQNHKIIDLGKLVKKVIPSAELLVTPQDEDNRNYRVDFSKIKNVLDFKAERTIQDGIRALKRQIETENIPYTDKFYSNIKFLKELEQA